MEYVYLSCLYGYIVVEPKEASVGSSLIVWSIAKGKWHMHIPSISLEHRECNTPRPSGVGII